MMNNQDIACELYDPTSIFRAFMEARNTPGSITGYEKLYLERDLSGRLNHVRGVDYWNPKPLKEHLDETVSRMAYWNAMYPLLKNSDRIEDQEAADLIVVWMETLVENTWGSHYLEDFDFICTCDISKGYTCPKPECQESAKEVQELLNDDAPMSPPYEVTTPSYGLYSDEE